MEHLYCVIMAGGRGERFWPLSTKNVPKPFVRLFGDRTMIQMTVDRILGLVPLDHIFVVLGGEHEQVARKQLANLGKDQFIVEPAGRDTAACIGLAATLLHRRDPEGVMIVLPADHYIPDTAAFIKTVSRTVEWAMRGDFLVTVGINPTRPDVGYGYIKAGESVTDADPSTCKVDRFVEKPDLEKALQYLSEGIYYWNAGLFVWRTRALLDGLKRHMGELYRGLAEIDRAMSEGNAETVARVFAGFNKVSIDYGLMEKADNVLMVKANFAWDDVGTWGSLRRVMELDGNGNFRSGRTICVDTRGCVVYGQDVPVGTVGVEDLIV
ncbi:MAG TPA: mannose-1-phosphate guanylyltransferase, partial [Syntrophorhabdales bacterium]|nr:mannose-1-phosphate guanylyltransferase [Syntrophorhabdales bacterium]